MAEYGDLVEYLLGIRKPGGGRLTRFGVFITRIPQFPPNFTITTTVFPRFGAYGMIQYLGAISPSMVPGAFWMTSYQMGIQFQGAFLSQMIQGIHNSWLEITQNNPTTTTITNVTGLLQYFEFGNSYLLMDTEQDYREVGELIENWGSMHGVQVQWTGVQPSVGPQPPIS